MSYTDTIGRIGRRMTVIALPLLVGATGMVAAHGGGGYGNGMMGAGLSGGGMGGVFGGSMGLGGFLWMVLLVAIPLYLVYVLLKRESGDQDVGPVTILRERYARGDISDEEYERRRAVIEDVN